MKLRKLAAILTASALALTCLTACGGGDSSSGGSGGSSGGGSSSSSSTSGSGGGGGASGEKVNITVFNTKSEITEYLEQAAEKYEEDHNVHIEFYISNDTVSAHLSTKYASGDPYTINMVDAKDVYAEGKTYGADMTGQKWVDDTDFEITVDGKVIGFPVCVEARGILYNADAIKNVTGEDFDPNSIQTLDDFTAFCDKLVAGGMESPTAILKPDWSLAAHYIQQVYEERPDVEAFVQSLYAGEVDLMSDDRFNSLMDTFDALMKYNLFKDSPIAVEDDQVHQAMSEGEVAFQFGGCWEWNDIIDYDYTGNIGIMPVPQNMSDEFSGKLVGGGSKFFYVDNSEYTTDEQRQAAFDFLDWLVYSEEGQTLVSDTCGMVSPFGNNTVPCNNDLGAAVKTYVDAGKLIPNYDYDPADHITKVGARMQEYLAGVADRATLAKNIQDYWASSTPVEH